MKQIIANGLKQLNEEEQVQTTHPVAGGDINEAYYVRTTGQAYFVKLNKQAERAFFELEAEGLKQIKETNTIAVPTVYAVTEDEEYKVPMLWLEWVEGAKSAVTEQLLGERLAALHLSDYGKYGYEQDSYIGKLKQTNGLQQSWLAYYRDKRLFGQLEIGRTYGTISGNREKQLVHLIERLDEWIPDQPIASMLHGDLWGGNWLAGEGGVPYLIDPSLLYGDHEFELAFTELFGGFSNRFYDAYEGVFPLSEEYESRKELYQLYYLLVHLNMFGEAYGTAVDRIIQTYTK